jgi:D-alanine--poly(phosphoribitol) ligase subunit 2
MWGMADLEARPSGVSGGPLTHRIARILEERLSIVVPSHQTDLVETGLLDSLGIVELLLAIEEEFGLQVQLEDLDLEALRSVAQIARLVEDRRSGVTD